MSDSPTPRRAGRAPLARYANYFEVGHNPYEFLIDFGQFQPDAGEVVLHCRIALNPAHAKMLSRMLRGAVDRYEAENGPLASMGEAPDPMAAILGSLPDFERRAQRARQAAGASPATSRKAKKEG